MSENKLEKALKVLNGTNPGSIMKLVEGDLPTYTRIPTGSIGLDAITGGGFPLGRVIELYGGESSGKSTCCLQAIREAQKMDIKCLFIDMEQAYDATYAEALGVKNAELYLAQPSCGEDALDMVRTISETGEIGLIIVDSIATLVPKVEIEGEIGDNQMGLQARMMSKALRMIMPAANKNNTCIIFTNQIREKIGVMFGCLHADMPIIFTDGRSFPIRKVVEEKIQGKVYCYNELTGVVEEKKITDWHFNGKVVSQEDFIHLETNSIDGRGRFGITVTPNHKLMTDKGWVEAFKVNVGDSLLSKYDSIYHDDTKEILQACLVGDASVCIRSRNTACIKFQDLNNKEYVQWKISQLPLNFTSLDDNVFISEFNYELSKLKNNVINRNPLQVFTEGKIGNLALAVWLMDDGHYKKSHNSYSISIKRFKNNKEVLEGIINLFKKSGLECTYTISTGSINFYTRVTEEIVNRVAKYIPQSMSYKLPPNTKFGYGKIEKANKIIKTDYVSVVTKDNASKRKLRQKGKYDISVEGNHNYFSGGYRNGVLVHNSPETTPGGNAMKFYASIRLKFTNRDSKTQLDSDGVKKSKQVGAKCIKNKTFPPFRECSYYIEFGKGIDNLTELIELATEKGVIGKSGSWFNYHETKLGQGLDNVKLLLADNDELVEEIKAELND